METRRRPHFEPDAEAFPAEHYTVSDYRGVAVYVLGWETEPDEETEWSGYENRTGRAVYVMVGDDRRLTCDPEDLAPLAEDGFCRGCGQTGCGHNVVELDEPDDFARVVMP
jgi:hypothetical protein